MSVFRIFQVTDKLINSGGELSDLEINTYRYMYSQLNDDQKNHLKEAFNDTLGDVMKEYQDDFERMVAKNKLEWNEFNVRSLPSDFFKVLDVGMKANYEVLKRLND